MGFKCLGNPLLVKLFWSSVALSLRGVSVCCFCHERLSVRRKTKNCSSELFSEKKITSFLFRFISPVSAILKGFLCLLAVVSALQCQTCPWMILFFHQDSQLFADKENHNITQPIARQPHVESYNGATIVYVGTYDTNDRTLRALVDKDGDNQIDEVHELFKSVSSTLSSFHERKTKRFPPFL